MNDETSSVEKPTTRFVSGAIWMVSMRWAMRLIGLTSTMILARLLMPDDFGVIAMAMVVIALIDTLADTGVDLALIREQSDSQRQFDAAWTIQILQGLLIAACLVGVSPLAVDYFSEDKLLWALHALAIAALIQGFQNIGIVSFRRQLDFSKDFRFSIYVRLSVFVVTVVLALVLRDYRAIIFSMVFKSVMNVAFSYGMHQYRPRISIRGMAKIWSFSQWLLVSRIGAVVNDKASQIVLGGMFGTSLLGYYYIAVELGTIFVFEIVMPIRRAFFPNLSRLLQDRQVFSEYAVRVVGIVAIACLPIAVGLYLTAPEVIAVLLGEKWLEATAALRWVALYSAAASMALVFDLLLLVLGKPKLSSIKVWSETLVLIPILYVVGQQGDMALIAEARYYVALLFLPLMFIFTVREMKIPYWRFLAVMWRPLLACFLMVIVDRMLLGEVSGPAVIRLIYHALLGGMTYLFAIVMLWLPSGRPDSVEQMVVTVVERRVLHRGVGGEA